MIFYHGSTVTGITELKPHSAVSDMSDRTLVYLTPNRAYALFYIRDIDINWVTCGVTAEGIIRYDERFSGQLLALYKDISGYLYRCVDTGAFQRTQTKDIWISNLPVQIDDAEYIPNVYEEIQRYEKNGEIKINYYETLTDDEKQQQNQIMIRYIYGSNLIHSLSKKAAFFKFHCPEQWNFVLSYPQICQKLLDDFNSKRNR